jgi:protein-tyrosine phosphatase
MNRSTSQNDPIQVNFIDGHDLPAAGKLGLTFAPGKKGPAYHSATIWDRDVNSDLQRMVDHYGMSTLVSLMEDFEYPLLEIADLFSQAESQGVEVVHYPIRDVSVPPADAMAGFASLISDITARLASGETVVAHCRGGLGRTGLVAAAVLVAAGHEPERAIKAVRSARPRTLETRAQERYVHDFAQYLEASNAELA